MVQLILYTTSGCHLCEEAEIMLKQLTQQGVCQWQAVEIAEDEQLVDRYGVRIPVVSNVLSDGKAEEIGWPFDQEQLEDWLKTCVLG
ncbi:MAG: glutaredoxin family protein [Endozoicomonas sp.]